ncbi:SRPBCC domain-containing protein [Aestuariibius sp. 2305UL40-4]|uniref:SRPBCC domain-containing protein n=1 Tax=Aestuariibius violaceus TaxID=3234132 RepID=UPI00345EE920
MPLDPIKVVTTIKRNPQEAFDAFVSKVSLWWPLETHSVSPYLGEPVPEIVVIERHEGGQVFEISAKGERRAWGTILAYEEGKHISFSWHPGLSEAEATTVSVEFESADDGSTVITLVHTGWEARGDQAVEMRGNYLSGWADIMQNRFTGFTKSL